LKSQLVCVCVCISEAKTKALSISACIYPFTHREKSVYVTHTSFAKQIPLVGVVGAKREDYNTQHLNVGRCVV
jgi:hypothetical protein